mgnify:CR=1 FL=1|jgi:hypothetical protein
MAKKKTRVMLPGGIQGLVHDLQNGTSKYAQRPIVEDVNDAADDEQQEVADDREQEAEQGGGAETVAISVAEERPTTDKAVGQSASTEKQVRPEVTPVDTPQSDRSDERAGQSEATSSAEVGKDADAPNQPAMREYHIVKDDSKDSWDLFIDMARQYKSGDGKLATIYIDETLKSVLDRMKYAGTEKLSTSAILSSIVARFIYDHEDQIRKVLFSGDLI